MNVKPRHGRGAHVENIVDCASGKGGTTASPRSIRQRGKLRQQGYAQYLVKQVCLWITGMAKSDSAEKCAQRRVKLLAVCVLRLKSRYQATHYSLQPFFIR